MKRVGLLIFSALALVLSGCSNDGQYQDLKNKMLDIKSRPKGRIEPPPEFKVYKAFTYSAAVMRSPFEQPVDVEMTALPKRRSSVTPDFNRPKEVLEQFSVDALLMVGSLKRPGGTLYALVRDPDSGLHRVAEGNYIGRNFGKVTSITPNKIDLIEIVSDGQDGWVERPRALVLRDE